VGGRQFASLVGERVPGEVGGPGEGLNVMGEEANGLQSLAELPVGDAGGAAEGVEELRTSKASQILINRSGSRKNRERSPGLARSIICASAGRSERMRVDLPDCRAPDTMRTKGRVILRDKVEAYQRSNMGPRYGAKSQCNFRFSVYL